MSDAADPFEGWPDDMEILVIPCGASNYHPPFAFWEGTVAEALERFPTAPLPAPPVLEVDV